MTGTKSGGQPSHVQGYCCKRGAAHPLFNLLSRLARGGASLSVVCAALALASAAAAQVTVVDDFESYANSAALQAAWVAQAPLPSASVTLDPAGITGKSMSIAYDVSAGTNAVEFTFGMDQDYSLRTTFRILYEVASGSANEDIVFELRDSMDNVLVTGVAPNGTSAVGLTKWEVNLVPVVENLTAVRKIRLAVRDGGDMAARHRALRRSQRQLRNVLHLPRLPRRVPRQALRVARRRSNLDP